MATLPIAPPGERFNLAQHLIEANARRPEKIAYVDDHGSLSYGALEEGIRRTASALLAAGLERGDRVLVLMLDGNEWPTSFLGAMYAGLVPIAVNTLLTAADYAYMLSHSGARAAIVSQALLATFEQAMAAGPNRVRAIWVSRAEGTLPDGAQPLAAEVQAAAPLAEAADTRGTDPGCWFYSSGSTGKPKGTVHSHLNPWWCAELFGKRVLGIREDDVCFSAAKLFFAYGFGNSLLFPLSVGARIVLMAERPTPDAVFRRLVEQRPTIFFGAPTGYAGMLASPRLPAREQVALRMCSSAGEALPAEIGQRWTAHYGCEVIDGIGSTEMLHVYLSNRPGDVHYGTTGRPVEGYDIELRGEDGGAVADGQVGDLYVRGPSRALEYWADPEKTRQVFGDGWCRSGDKYVRNADGTYTYAGRSDDMLKVSGIYVSPFEVEATLMQHPAVLECAVIGVTDEAGLTKTKAFVVLKPGGEADEGALKAFVKDRLAPFKYPRLIEFVDELPKTATGKIQRFRLRERERRE